MNTQNANLMNMAWESLRGKRGLAIGTFVVYFLITSIPSHMEGVGFLICLLVSGPFALGLAMFSLSISRNEDAKMEQIFQGFNFYGTTLKAHLLMTVYILLWSLLLIVPGIVVALSYSMTFFILADDKTLKAKQAMEKSKDMMDGHKLKLFYMCLRFLGLSILCIFTLGIGFLWLFPYMQISIAKFYEDIRGVSLEESTN